MSGLVLEMASQCEEAVIAGFLKKVGTGRELIRCLLSSTEALMIQYVVLECALSLARATEPANRVAGLDCDCYLGSTVTVPEGFACLAPPRICRLKRLPHGAYGRPRLANFRRRNGVEGVEKAKAEQTLTKSNQTTLHLSKSNSALRGGLAGPRDSRAKLSFIDTVRCWRTRGRRT